MKGIKASDHALYRSPRLIDRSASQLRVHCVGDALPDTDAPIPHSGHGSKIQLVVLARKEQPFLFTAVPAVELDGGWEAVCIEAIGNAAQCRDGIHNQRDTLVVVAMGDDQYHRPSMPFGHSMAPQLKAYLRLEGSKPDAKDTASVFPYGYSDGN